MENFSQLMTLIWRLVNYEFTLYGYTFSFANIIYVILGASVICVLKDKLLSD